LLFAPHTFIVITEVFRPVTPVLVISVYLHKSQG
jgi:hypothetical protein